MIYIAVLILLVCLVLGVPVPMSFMASTAWLLFFGGPTGAGYASSMVLPYGFSSMNSIALISIALFIMAGGIMEKGRIGEKLIDFVDVFVGRIKGGLGVVGTISCAVFGSITGSACATLSCIGSIMFPRLEAAGYPRGIAAALMSNASLLGMLIPPNSTLIIFAWISGQSILACFLSTVLPGIMMTALICLVNCWLVRKNPNVKVTEPPKGRARFNLMKQRGFVALPALMLPFIVLGGIYGGIMTPTEAAAVAVIYAIPTGMFIYKGLTLRGLWDSLVESAVTTGVVMVMLYSVMMLSRLYIMENLPGKMLGLFRAVSENPWIILFMINIFLVVMGMLMDDISSVTLGTPILIPIIIELGFNPIHYAAIVGVNTGLGCITPPAAPVLYLGGRLGKAPINEMMGPTLWIIALAWTPTLLITTYFPRFSLLLPHLFLGTPW
ncbi:MAG: TRAP transporter large permease [Synergistaceae bacterium]|jgi:tripartite ATP-independent transporter DctM subunit|nr:TRAP transporter large permease [Synergistaceae bacterium]MDD3915757.1 TRAP transporter large permease [Synergistaceae bacterium]HRV97295.1 TRAP transporter large permease [Aminobacteriaceae bacterium]